jgi:formate hydrogenlyase subunit 3/multisubunit Na+/H+ antiporter MnhD subunit
LNAVACCKIIMFFLYLILLNFAVGLFQLTFSKLSDTFHRVLLLSVTLLNLAIFVVTFVTFGFYSDELVRIDTLSSFTLLAVSFFTFIVSFYSFKFDFGEAKFNKFSAYTLWTFSAAIGVTVTNNLIYLLVSWGILALTLYLLVNLKNDAAADAKKAFIIVGATDALMLLGVAIIWSQRGSFAIFSKNPVDPAGLGLLAFLCFTLAAFAKAGAMPVHSWIPDVSQKALLPVTTLIPTSLDKLLGIYLLVRVVKDLFLFNSFVMLFLLISGTVTIILAVLMAIVQHDIKRLLSYCAISQVGYMVVGIGTGSILGFAAALFHMLNHAMYKTTLFMSAGAIEQKLKTQELDEMGGLSRVMPVTFASTIIAALSISGVPPLNGFVSKWMIYQSLIDSFNKIHSPWLVLALIASLFGSAFTLAIFVKMIHAAFLTSPKRPIEGLKEVGFTMWFPMALLAGLCVLFGVFAFQVPLRRFIVPSLDISYFRFSNYLTGTWNPGLATGLIFTGLLLGVALFFAFFKAGVFRKDEPFLGGNTIPHEDFPSGADFYESIKSLGLLRNIYAYSEKKLLDIYNVSGKIVTEAGAYLSRGHTGILHSYVSWVLVGFIFVLFLFLK